MKPRFGQGVDRKKKIHPQKEIINYWSESLQLVLQTLLFGFGFGDVF